MPTRVVPAGGAVDVLLVSGDWRLRAPLRAQLAEHGYSITALETWEEAELLVRTGALVPRMLVVDLHEEPNPEATLRTLAALGRGRPVLILTAPSVLSEDAVRALGFTDVLTRPFRIGEIEKIVERQLAAGAERPA